ncbi:MAG TPA: c-type cytochrome [Flavisolibacter sp.]
MKIRNLITNILLVSGIIFVLCGCGDNAGKSVSAEPADKTITASAMTESPQQVDSGVVPAQDAQPVPPTAEPKTPGTQQQAAVPSNPVAGTSPGTAKTAAVAESQQPATVTTTPVETPASPEKAQAPAVAEKSTPTPVVTKEVTPVETAATPAATVAPTQEKWVVPAKDKARTNPVTADAEALASGKTLYQKHCASCHGKTGAGNGPKAAQLKEELLSFRVAAFQKQTDGSLFYKIREGKDDMPAYKKKIPDEEEIWHVVHYIRTLQ